MTAPAGITPEPWKNPNRILAKIGETCENRSEGPACYSISNKVIKFDYQPKLQISKAVQVSGTLSKMIYYLPQEQFVCDIPNLVSAPRVTLSLYTYWYIQ